MARLNKALFLLWVTAIFSHNLVIFPVSGNYYSSPADPHGQPSPSTSTPSIPTGSSPHGHHGGSSHSPHHGGGSSSSGSSGGCNTPPSSGGGVSLTPPPAGGYYNSPPTAPVVTPAPPLIDLAPPTPAFDITPPTLPSPPISVDPGTGTGSLPPFPCTYWGSHPTLIWGVLGWFGTVGNLFGTHSLPGGISPSATVQQVLSNARSDGYSSLYREATAAMLNSMALATTHSSSGHTFPFTPVQIRDAFISALDSNHAAASQARLFRLANEGHLKLV